MPRLGIRPLLYRFFLALGPLLAVASGLAGQSDHSVARQWNEILLEAIRNDLARPTIHARNLFHVSAAMYDAWAAYDGVADTYLLGRNQHGYAGCTFEGLPVPDEDAIQAAREEAISYAAYRIIRSRFRFSPGGRDIARQCDALMDELGYDPFLLDLDYRRGKPAALGNYIGQCYLQYGLQDGSNEELFYENTYYQPVNPPLFPDSAGNPDMIYPDRWQPLSLETFIDQSGNPIAGNIPFLSPEWGQVAPFAMAREDLTIHTRDGHEYWVYHDPGPPPRLGSDDPAMREAYKWGFSLVSIWGGHLDPDDGVVWDISPRSIGNMTALHDQVEDYPEFYDLFEGGDPSQGHPLNPATGAPYEPQYVPRGDYARVLAEFWADGPDSETPPGHWFVILNYVNDHPFLRRRFRGQGPLLDPLQWDVKSYFLLGGAMHDAAISAWGIKGYYDYVRPVSAIRYMADRGQSSDPGLPRYHPEGIPLHPGHIELVSPGDPLAGPEGEHVGKIKLYTWRGHRFIQNTETDEAGVGWILAEHWWPYQRPSFVTPPFAGYVSGHSTYSRAAAEVLTVLTGDPYFPGGMGEFVVKADEFLVFEDGPSQDFTLQWATYRDASDQTSLSRIWGGIHPPADDIPGRLIGIKVAEDAFALAERHFNGEAPDTPPAVEDAAPEITVFPNPVPRNGPLIIRFDRRVGRPLVHLYNLQGQLLYEEPGDAFQFRPVMYVPVYGLPNGLYLLQLRGQGWTKSVKVVVGE